jgi:hypothetical protein
MERTNCDHKFVDSKACLKCGWVPPKRDAFSGRIAAAAPQSETAAELQARDVFDTMNYHGITARDGEVLLILPVPRCSMNPSRAIQLAAWLVCGAEMAGHPNPEETFRATLAAIRNA